MEHLEFLDFRDYYSIMLETTPIRSNVPEFSVSELAFSMKRTLEDNFACVRVRGELSRVSIPSSGHMYSALKDDKSVIDAVCWKGTLSKLSVRPEEGLEVICTGRITTYPARSNYQLIIESMELAGEGALLKMLEERKKRLGAEGLFAPERKKPIPFLPRKIGVITSPTGAVIRDILHRLNDRFPRHVLVWPVMVQGEGAAEQVTNAINGFNAMPIDQRPDLLIVARGGGSLEDLMPFNEENVVRATANSLIPIISAVGHETDTTLIDYASDLRAPTPTGAAEMAVPMRINLIAQVSDDGNRLLSGMSRLLSENRHRLDALSAKLGDPARLLEIKTQRLDHISDKVARVFEEFISRKERRLLQQSIRTPATLVREKENQLKRWSEQLQPVTSRHVHDKQKSLEKTLKMLELLSFENVLQRGYVVVRGADGKPITQAQDLNNGQAVTLQYKDQNKVEAVIGKAQAPVKQGQLF